MMEYFQLWEILVVGGILSWLFFSTSLSITHKIRALTQPWVTQNVINGIPLITKVQSCRHDLIDAFFVGLSSIVSVPFYTAFLPLLFWSGHSKLGRQMTLLMAFCDYLGNSIKDVVSAPRPSTAAIRRVVATKDEEENAMEFGLPSSHALNTVCFAGYLAYYVLSTNNDADILLKFALIGGVCVLVALIGLGRIYLGMHSLIDVIGGVVLGSAILVFWISVHQSIDAFIISGQHVVSFWATLAFLLLFAYPKPEYPTPSFEFHTAFNGVALGIVTGVHQNYHDFHHENVPRLFISNVPLWIFIARVLVGLPTILVVKFCSKALAKWLLPILCNTLSIPIWSSSYIPSLKAQSTNLKKKDGDAVANPHLPVGYFGRVLQFICRSQDCYYNVDTGIRFLQYAGLAWSVVDLVPSLFSLLSL